MGTILVALVIATFVVHGEKPKPQSTAHAQSPSKAVQEPGSVATPSIVAVNQNASQREEENHPKKSPNYLILLFSPENLPAIALVIVDIAGIVVAIRTLKNIEHQTKSLAEYVVATKHGVEATRDSAIAAQRTVEVMEADQRARVGATRVDITDFHPGEQSKAVLWVKNFGKSTAVNVNVEWYMEPGPERTYWHAFGGNAPAVTLFPEAEFPLPVETSSPVSV
jgi:hypothetical protein